MPSPPKILAFAGSTREKSYNKLLVRIVAAGVRAGGGDVTLLDLRDDPLPLFDEDLEARDGLPAAARRMKDVMLAHHALLIASPEYNSSISGVLKNAIDWASRPVPGEAPLGCFAGKPAAIVSASPGGLGGLRGLVHLRAILGNINMLVIPDTISISKAHEAFNADGTLKDARQQATADGIGRKLAALTARLQA